MARAGVARGELLPGAALHGRAEELPAKRLHPQAGGVYGPRVITAESILATIAESVGYRDSCELLHGTAADFGCHQHAKY